MAVSEMRWSSFHIAVCQIDAFDYKKKTIKSTDIFFLLIVKEMYHTKKYHGYYFFADI